MLHSVAGHANSEKVVALPLLTTSFSGNLVGALRVNWLVKKKKKKHREIAKKVITSEA